MSNNTTRTVVANGNFFTLLAIAFITLKLTGHLDWSWTWVLAPLWGPFAFVFGIIGLVYVMMGVAALVVIVFGAIASLFVKR